MKRRLIAIAFTASICLTACGNISDKVSQSMDTIEFGTTLDIEKAFMCENGVTIKLKLGETLDTSVLGNTSAVFMITDGKNEEEKNYTFNVVDTQVPEIDAKDVTIYAGTKFTPEDYVMCVDNSGEEIAANVKMNNVDTTTAGTYMVTYEASDSSGNSAEQNIIVEVLPIETAEDVMDLIDQYISQKGYKNFSYDKNELNAVYVIGKNFNSKKINSDRYLSLYPEIWIIKDIFTSKYKADGIVLRFEFNDTSKQSERYDLYPNKLIIKSKNNSITNICEDVTDIGEFDRYHYLSIIEHTLGKKDVKQLSSMINEGFLTLKLKAVNSKEGNSLEEILNPVEEPVSFSYKLKKTDIKELKKVMDIYYYLVDVLGEFDYGD